MIIYPAIDILGGKCVRLEQGDFSRATEYSGDPAAQAAKWEELGASFIHVVDLDGAKSGSGLGEEAVRAILAAVRIPIQVGGGIRTMLTMERYLAMGVRRVILGTAAVRDPGFAREAAREYGRWMAVGVDARDGMVAVEGWGEVSAMKSAELCGRMRDAGVSVIIHTDIARDGMMSGPNLESTKEVIALGGLDVIVSGGVSSMDDLSASREIGAGGAIIGRALYTGAIDLREAVSVFEKKVAKRC
jgi:phosphoribosylformimino-5-aminoimidazole carboxamide ribotide isomerase